MRPVLVALLVLAVSACDSAAPPPAGPPLTDIDFVHQFQLYRSPNGEEATDADARCWFGPYEGREGGALEYGRLRFGADGRFEFYAETRALYVPEDITVRDTFRVLGAYDRRGPLLTLRLDTGDHVWYGTAGPSPESPTTVVLGDYSDDGIAFGGGRSRGSNGCGLTVLSPQGEPPDRSLETQPGARSESFRFEGLVRDGRYSALPLVFGRKANNRIEGGTLTLKPDGTYHVLIRDVEGDDYYASNTWRNDKEAEGTYVDYGGVLAFDVGTSGLGFGLFDGDTLRIAVEQGPVWPLRISGDADRVLVRN